MSSKPRKLFYLFPWHLLAVLLLLLAAGLVNLYSASAGASGTLSNYFHSQLVWTGIGLALLLLMLGFHYRLLLSAAVPIYVVSLVLLALVIVMGKASGGQKNWLVLGPLRLQPSEFAKLAVVLMLARYFQGLPVRAKRVFRDFIPAIGIVLLPMALILVEKDLGSALFFALIGGTFLFIAGLPYRFIVVALVLASLGGAAAYKYFLSDYQRDRIQTFLHPERDPRGKGYHLVQSKIAVGSGRLVGKGFLKGDLNKFKFLPERHTDFVFPVLAEEWGFLGGVAVLSGFLLLLFMMLQGVVSLLFWQVAINLGGVLGLMPLAGVTLPFFSYGGSALLSSMLAVGVAFNVLMRRYMF
ncbi:MAG: rod shape-determining protein RodA [Deltaproteobacteria bacterium]|nr:rod shape-determining protein RodA [Deltaproteobacteria bacterium]